MTKKYIRKFDYDSTILDDEWIILNTDNFTVTKTNEVGGYCWELLQKPQTISSLIHALEGKYNYQTSNEDIEAFLIDMMKCGLVENEN